MATTSTDWPDSGRLVPGAETGQPVACGVCGRLVAATTAPIEMTPRPPWAAAPA